MGISVKVSVAATVPAHICKDRKPLDVRSCEACEIENFRKFEDEARKRTRTFLSHKDATRKEVAQKDVSHKGVGRKDSEPAGENKPEGEGWFHAAFALLGRKEGIPAGENKPEGEGDGEGDGWINATRAFLARKDVVHKDVDHKDGGSTGENKPEGEGLVKAVRAFLGRKDHGPSGEKKPEGDGDGARWINAALRHEPVPGTRRERDIKMAVGQHCLNDCIPRNKEIETMLWFEEFRLSSLARAKKSAPQT